MVGVLIWVVRGFSPFDLAAVARLVNAPGMWHDFWPDAWAADLYRVLFNGFQRDDALHLIGLAGIALLTSGLLFIRDHDFYEAATELSVRRASMTAAMRSGNAGVMLSQMASEGQLAKGHTLPDFGGGARAILWKDLIAATRIPPRHYLQLLIPAAFPAVLGAMFGRDNGFNVLGWTTLYSLQMPGIFLLTLRDMLRRADITKALPLSSLKMLGAELLLPLVQLTALGWMSLLMVFVAGLWRGPLLLVAVIVLPSLAALLFFVQAIFVLVYPNPNDPAQHAVSGVLSLGVSLLALIPGLLVGIPLFFIASSMTLALSVFAVNTVFAALALYAASRLWRTFDPTE